MRAVINAARGKCRVVVAGGILGGILLLSFANAVSAITVWLPFDQAFEMSDIVCTADAIEFVPAPEATAEIPRTTWTFRLRPLHIWKGNPPDTLILLGNAGRVINGEWTTGDTGARFTPGGRYLVFASRYARNDLPSPHTHTRELENGKADLLLLARTIGPGRSAFLGAPEPPSISYQSLMQDLKEGDSPAQMTAVNALQELGDSSGVVLPALVHAVRSGYPVEVRRTAGNAISRWAELDTLARRAYVDALKDGDPATRLAAVDVSAYPEIPFVKNRILEMRRDLDPEVRRAVLVRLRRLLPGYAGPPTHEYVNALRDSAAIVQIEAIHLLHGYSRDPEIKAALENCLADQDSTVAAAARKVLSGP